MLVTPPFGASSNIALWRAYSKPPVELVVADLARISKQKTVSYDLSREDALSMAVSLKFHTESN